MLQTRSRGRNCQLPLQLNPGELLNAPAAQDRGRRDRHDRRGAQISTIAELLGHADLRMTARYTHATDFAKRRAVEAAAKVVEMGKSGHNLVTMKKREA